MNNDTGRRTIRVVHKSAEDGAEYTRPFLGSRGPSKMMYQPSGEVVVDPIAREISVRDCRREWLAFKGRYGHLTEFADIIAED